MSTYEIVTLIDITNSRIQRGASDPLKLGQQSNFNTLCQTIGLRSNYNYVRDPKQESGGLPHNIGGKATYWTWQFETERSETYLCDGDPVGFLKQDLHGVPIANMLNNSTDIDPAVFQTLGDNANTWIYEIT